MTCWLLKGHAKLLPLPRGQKERVRYKLKDTNAALATNFGTSHPPDSTWFKCRHVISASLDQCFVGSWVFAESATDKAGNIRFFESHAG